MAEPLLEVTDLVTQFRTAQSFDVAQQRRTHKRPQKKPQKTL